MASDANTVTVIVARLEALGLVRRTASDTDRRAQWVRLTAAGRRKFARAQTVARALQEELLSLLPRRRRAAFLRDLEVIANAGQMVLERTRSQARAGRGRREDRLSRHHENVPFGTGLR